MDQMLLCLPQRVVRGSLPLKKRKLMNLNIEDHHRNPNFPQLSFGRQLYTSGTTAFESKSLATEALEGTQTLLQQQQQHQQRPSKYSHSPLAVLPDCSMALSMVSSSGENKIAALALVAEAASKQSLNTDACSAPFLPLRSSLQSLTSKAFESPRHSSTESIIEQQQSHKENRAQTTQDNNKNNHDSAAVPHHPDAPQRRRRRKQLPKRRQQQQQHDQIPFSPKPLKSRTRDLTSQGDHRSTTPHSSKQHNSLTSPRSTVPFIDIPHDHSESQASSTTTSSSSSTSSSSHLTSHSPSRRSSNASATPHHPVVPESSHAHTSNQHHQDKRYTGASDETCCKATTTRGRPCTYVAVHPTHYCHLHAQYDANPPQRRTFKAASALISPVPTKPVHHCSITSPNLPPCAEVSVTYPPSVSSEDSMIRLPSPLPQQNTKSSTESTNKSTWAPAKTGRGRRTTIKLAGLHAESPHPLLSMIPTENWFGKTVVVATGPMAKREGKVEKWGNGWISVRIPGVGLHNRRSFELYLKDEADNGEDEEDDDDDERDGFNEEHRDAELEEVSQKQQQNTTNNKISRCISADDAVSPSPDIQLQKGEVNEEISKPRTPKLKLRISASTVAAATGAGEKGQESKRDAESMQRQKDKTKKVTDTRSSTCDFPSHEQYDDGLEGGIPHSPLKRSRTELPLIESVLLQEKGLQPSQAKKHKFDLLFGTAALDRSRRTIKKPTLYDPLESIGSPSSHAKHHPKRRSPKQDKSVEGGPSVDDVAPADIPCS